MAADKGNYALIWLDDNSLWAAGDNSQGFLGLGSMGSNHLPFTRITSIPQIPIIDIAVKGKHNMVLLADGSLWVAGSNLNRGLGLGSAVDAIVFTHVSMFDKKITQIAAGEYGSFAQLEDGSVWAAGNNIAGHLGFAEELSSTYKMLSLRLPLRCTQISVGERHALFLLEDGTVWGMGDNSAYQLSLDHSDSYYHADEGFDIQPLQQLKLQWKELPPVRKIYAGFETTFILLQNGELLGGGGSQFGELGTGKQKDIQRFFYIKPLIKNPQPIVDVAASYTHTVLLFNDGSLWFAGHNGVGQFGLGNMKNHNRFIRCPFIA